VSTLVGEPASLPLGKVAVLKRKSGERRRPAVGIRLVERTKLGKQHSLRAAVECDVVEHKLEDVVVVTESEQVGADDRPPLEIEGHLGQLVDELLGRELALIGRLF